MTIPKPTLHDHIALARDIRRAEAALSRLLDHSDARFFTKTERNRLLQSCEMGLGMLKSRLDDDLFKSNPEATAEWTKLYYGKPEDVRDLENMLYGIAAGRQGR